MPPILLCLPTLKRNTKSKKTVKLQNQRKVRSFFSVKNEEKGGKICLQGYSGRVFESIIHRGARGYSKVYARRTLAP